MDPTEPLTVLVVEDVRDMALLLRRSLERAGHHVTTCPSAEAARFALDLCRYDLISLDRSLPDMSGLDFLRELKQEGNTTPVIMATAYGDEGGIAQALRDGALDYVVMDPALNFLVEYPERVRRAVMRFRCRARGPGAPE
jgi:DNA-binding response OmpR family regulator